ncbi:glycosyltransferase [Geodermatophilus sp. SYSU D00691]
MEKPAVSVIIPAWQAAATIGGTLASLARQTQSSWEAIVVDDGSTDATADETERLALQDPRIRVLRGPHRGASAARNTGIAAARAEWLLFLDADDVLEPTALARLSAQASQGTDLITCGWARVTPDGRRLADVLPPPPGDWFEILAERCPVTIHACLVKRDAVEIVGGFDEELVTCEDWDLWQRIVRRGNRVEVVPEVLALYCVRVGAASNDETRFLIDAVEVLRRGHAPDPRVPDPAERHRMGRPASEVPTRAYGIASWLAGQAIGAGRDANGLLSFLDGVRAPGLEAVLVAEALTAGLEVHGTERYWDEVGPALLQYLADLEMQSGAVGLIGEARRHLEGVVLDRTPGRPATAGTTHAVRLQLGEDIRDVHLPSAADVLRAELQDDGQVLGVVTVPAVCGAVRGLVLADALAAELGWWILGRYFGSHLYAEGEDHNAVGWVTFLRELWGRPDWSEADFYDLRRRDDAPAPHGELQDGWLHVDVALDLPRLPKVRGDVPVAVSVGGRPIGGLLVRARRGLGPQQLRAAISSGCGTELLTAAVREGLLFERLGGSLRARLRDAVREGCEIGSQVAVLGRHPAGGVMSPASRHATLPRECTDLLEPSLVRSKQPLIGVTAQTAAVHYAPDVLWTLPPQPQPLTAPKSPTIGRNFTRHDFESLFAADADPWKYTTEYERTKYEQTLELIPNGPIDDAIELGCAAGHFTTLLAPRVTRLVAADISSVALDEAKERCHAHPNVEYLQLDVGSDELPGQYDLVVCSEMLYFTADRKGFPVVAQRLASALRPGGHLVTAHGRVVADGGPGPAFDWEVPFGADFIGSVLSRTDGLERVRELRTPLYSVQVFRRVDGVRRLQRLLAHRRVDVEQRPLTAVLEPDVERHVRWDEKQGSTTHDTSIVTERLPVLMYHRVAQTGSKALSRYRVSPQDFDEQLGYLAAAGFRSATFDEWAEARRLNRALPGRRVIITFDDAYVDFAEEAWPLLRKYGFSATLFVPTAHVGKTNAWDAAYGEEVPLLGWEALRDLRDEQVTMGAHGHTHRPLSALASGDVAREAARSRVELENRLQVPVTAVAYPYGRFNSVVTHLHAASGFLHGVTTRSALSSLKDPALSLPRVEVIGGEGVPSFIRRLGADGDRRV